MNPKFIAAAGISLLSLACIVIILVGFSKVLNRTGWDRRKQQRIFTIAVVSILSWVVLVGVLAINGFFADFSKMPPRPLFVVILPLPVILFAAFSKKGTALLKATPPHWLIAIQAFRIFVELLLWRAAVMHLLPVQMSFEGYNFDVFSGILAIIVAVRLRRKWSRALVIGYNIIGLLLLINILAIAVLSMPTPLRHFMNEPSNSLVAGFPFIYLPAVLVIIAYGFHIFSLRQLAIRK